MEKAKKSERRNIRRDFTIGYRAAEEILKMAHDRDCSIAAILRKTGGGKSALVNYESGCAPSAFVLANMLREGFDVFYILTGRHRVENGRNIE